MNKILTLSAFLGISLCASGVAMAQNRIEFKEFKLDNGLTVLMHRDNATPIVAVSVMYHVGSKNENPERTGFRSEEHTSELQSLMRISYAVFCLTNKNTRQQTNG